MAATRDQQCARGANFIKKVMPISLITAISQTGQNFFVFTPGYRFRVVSLSLYCLNLAGTVSVVGKVGPVGGTLRTAFASTNYTAATETTVTPSTTLANILGIATDQIVLQYTSNGSGALTNGFATLTWRHWPCEGELGQTT